MTRIWRVMLCCAGLVISSCGGGSSGSGTSSRTCSAFRVFNGEQCSSEALPVVEVVRDDGGRCTGTIISNDDVLTAAHCVIGGQGFIAKHDHGTQVATGAVFNPNAAASIAFDIGLLRFPNIANNFKVRPAHFGLSRPTKVGDKIKIVGYGEDGTDALAGGDPRATELVVSEISNGFLFTLFNSTNSGVCHGDSGAAATLDGLIVASVQGGDPVNCAKDNFNRFTNLQLEGNVGFLRQYVPTAVFE